MIIISSSGYVLVGNGSYLTGLEQTVRIRAFFICLAAYSRSAKTWTSELFNIAQANASASLRELSQPYPSSYSIGLQAIDSKLTFLRLDHQHRGLGGILIPVVSGYIFYKRKQYRRLNTDPGPRPMVFKSDPSGHAR
jgi:hypothetical protein